MHIADGILTPEVVAVTQVAAVGAVALGLRRARVVAKSPAQAVTTLGLSAAALFVVTSATFPAMAGTSAHPSGTPLLALLLGPLPTAVVTGIVVLFEALMGHGGLTAWGADTLTLGVLGPGLAWGAYTLVRRAGGSAFCAGAVAAALGNAAIYLSTAALMAYSLPGESFVAKMAAIVVAYLPAEVPIMAVESVVTGALVARLASLDVLARWVSPRAVVPTVSPDTQASA